VERLISEINEIMHLGHFGVELGLPSSAAKTGTKTIGEAAFEPAICKAG